MLWAVALLLVPGLVGAKKASSGDDISWEQAQCLFEGKKIVFLGDSNTRFWTYVFNVFLETGELRHDDYDKWGDPGKDYDKKYEGNTWTDWNRKKKGDPNPSHVMSVKNRAGKG